MNRQDALHRLQAASPRLKAAGVGALYLFGSTARDEAGPNSDVDLFFDPAHNRLSLFDVMTVRDIAQELVGIKVDLCTRSSLHPALRADIEAEAVRVF
ncbi:MAG: nucleotidyltransferase family protein [Alphaproteobacteria bacterium]|nr:nucleotidyltransferase family protein [Alphaproteobacteria bacterium]